MTEKKLGEGNETYRHRGSDVFEPIHRPLRSSDRDSSPYLRPSRSGKGYKDWLSGDENEELDPEETSSYVDEELET